MNPPPHSVWLGEGSGRGESQKISIRKNTDKQETTGQIADGEEKEEQANEFEDEGEQDQVPVSFDPVPEIQVDRNGVPRICSKDCWHKKTNGGKVKERRCKEDRDKRCEEEKNSLAAAATIAQDNNQHLNATLKWAYQHFFRLAKTQLVKYIQQKYNIMLLQLKYVDS